MNQKSGMFRKEALERLSTPEHLDRMLTITSSRSWVALLGAALVIVLLIIWAFTGSITTRVSGEGILLKPGGIARIVSTTGGQLTELRITPGEAVLPDMVVARITDPDGKTIPVYGGNRGRALEMISREGDLVAPGETLFTMEAVREGEPDIMETIIFVPVELGQKIVPGMDAYVVPVVINSEEHGFMMGRVSYVAEYPSSFEGAFNILGNEELAMRLAGRTLSIEIRIELFTDDSNPSGYRWTTGTGPDVMIRSGTLCQGMVVTEQVRPIALVFPILRD